MRKLIPISNPSEYNYNEEEQYIFKTKADNNIKGELISEIDAKSGEAYFLTTGKPSITIKFPWSEIVIIIVMMIVIIRLMFGREDLEKEEEIKKEIKKEIKTIKRERKKKRFCKLLRAKARSVLI